MSISSFAVDDCLDATRHAGYQRLAVLLCAFSGPTLLDCLLQVLSVWRLLVCHVILHNSPNGLRSGLFPGHSNTDNLFFFTNAVAPFDRWQWAPSCIQLEQPWTCMCRFILSRCTYRGPLLVVLGATNTDHQRHGTTRHPKWLDSADISLWLQHIPCQNAYPCACSEV